MPASFFRRFLHRVLTWSGPVLLVLVSIYQLLVWQSERLWFESLGYGAHFVRLFGWRAGAFCAGALIFGVWMGVNAQIAWRNAAARAVPLSFFQADDASRLIPLEDKLHLDRYRRRATLVILLALSWMAGLGFSARYGLFLRAFWLQSSGISDRASNFDLAFFLFGLPFYAWLSRFLSVSIVMALLLVLAIYLYEETIGPRVEGQFSGPNRVRAPRVSRAAAKHLAILWALLLIWKGVDCVLSVPESFVSSGNAATNVFDATDIGFGWTSAGLFALSAPLVALLSGLSIAREPRYRTFAFGLIWMISAGLVPSLLPLVVARSPQNIQWRDALARHLTSTRRAWGLENVTQRPFAPATEFRSARDEENRAAPASPLALWPAVAAQNAFNRRLEARGSDLRVRRAFLERAGNALLYIGLALPPAPKPDASWRARHERAPRGLLMAMQATRAQRDGTPIFLAGTSVAALLGAPDSENRTPRARNWADQTPFGSRISGDSDEWVIARTEGDSGALRGVSLANSGVKMLLAARFFEPNLLRETGGNDRLLWHRGAAARCRELAPFLDWRSEEARPVWVKTAGFAPRGELKWIVPGLVWSDDHPDSATPAAPGSAPPGANYGRHSAAGVVDARSGAVTLYLLDENEPFIALYNRAFPGLFALSTALPGEIRAALRPSPALLSAQSSVWARYHVPDPLSWLDRTANYRPLFFATAFDDAAMRPLASQPSGDWSFMAYARPEGQAGSGASPPLSAILGADERDFSLSGKTRFVEWRSGAPLALPAILVDPIAPATPGGPAYLPPTLLCVAPRLDEKGEAQGLIVTRGTATPPAEKTTGAQPQVQLQSEIQISGAAPPPAPLISPDLAAPLSSQLEQARAAWRDLRAARQKGDWDSVARAEQRLDAALRGPKGTQ